MSENNEEQMAEEALTTDYDEWFRMLCLLFHFWRVSCFFFRVATMEGTAVQKLSIMAQYNEQLTINLDSTLNRYGVFSLFTFFR